MKLGFAQTDITPDRPLSLAGFGGEVRLGRRGVRPLLAQAAYLQSNDGAAVLLFAADVIGFEQEWTDQLRARLHRALGLPPTHVIVNASHTHCGPQTLRGLKLLPDLGTPDKRYVRQLEDKLVQIGQKAVRNAKAAELRVATGTNTQVTHRRRWDGTRWINAPNFTDETERALPILDLRREDGVRLLIVIASGHPTTWAGMDYDPHYFGRARERLTAELGRKSYAMILQGITGDSKMTTPNPLTGGWIRDMNEDIRIVSTKITGDILRALPFSTLIEPSFSVATKSIRLPFWKGMGRDVPTPEALKMLANRKTVASWKRLLTGRTIPYEMQVLTFANDYRWIVLGGEPCTDVGRRAKAVFATGRTFALGYCNHMPAYIPSRRIAVEGGYEGRTSFQYFGHKHPLHPDCEDLIAEAVEQLKEIR